MSLTAATPPTMRECIYMSLWMTVCGFVYLYECHKSCVGVWMCMRQIASWGGGRWVGQGATREPTRRHTQKKWNHHSRHSKKQTRTIHGYYLDNKVTFTHWVLLCSGFFCPLLKGFCCYCFKLQQGGEERGTKEVMKHLFCPFGTPSTWSELKQEADGGLSHFHLSLPAWILCHTERWGGGEEDGGDAGLHLVSICIWFNLDSLCAFKG